MTQNLGQSITGFPNSILSDENRASLIDAFIERGESHHSGRAETVWALLQYCQEHGIPYRVEVARFEGNPVGVRITRTDIVLGTAPRVPGGWDVQVVERWAPPS